MGSTLLLNMNMPKTPITKNIHSTNTNRFMRVLNVPEKIYAIDKTHSSIKALAGVPNLL